MAHEWLWLLLAVAFLVGSVIRFGVDLRRESAWIEAIEAVGRGLHAIARTLEADTHDARTLTESLQRIERNQKRILHLEVEQMATVREALEQIRSQNGKLASIKTLVEQLKALLDQGAVDEAVALLRDNDALMDAILANPNPGETPPA